MTTPREQLAEMLQQDILPCGFIQYPTEPPTIVCDEHGRLSENQCPEALRIADALLKAGWTPPPTPAHNTLTHN